MQINCVKRCKLRAADLMILWSKRKIEGKSTFYISFVGGAALSNAASVSIQSSKQSAPFWQRLSSTGMIWPYFTGFCWYNHWERLQTCRNLTKISLPSEYNCVPSTCRSLFIIHPWIMWARGYQKLPQGRLSRQQRICSITVTEHNDCSHTAQEVDDISLSWLRSSLDQGTETR